MIRVVVGLFMIMVGMGTMDAPHTDLVNMGVLAFYMMTAGIVVMAWGIRGMAKKNSDLLD